MADQEETNKQDPEQEEDLKPVVAGETQPEVVEKVDEGPKRFVEMGPHVVHDTETNLYWMKKDSWQDKGKFFNWHESQDHAGRKNIRKIGGFEDWRIPTNDEAATLYNESWTNSAKGGDTVHIDTVFPEGSFKVEWAVSDTATRRPRFDYTQGKVIWADEYAFGSVRLVRKAPVKRDDRAPKRNRR